MALIIEDGSQVTNSDSYVTRAVYIAYALTLGVTIADEEETDQKLRKAAIYISSKESHLIGVRVDRDQSLAYPRSNLWIEGFYWEIDEIPTQVKNAQMNLALDLEDGIDLYNLPQSDNVGIKKEKIDGAIEVEYAIAEGSKISRKSSSQALISQLTSTSSFSISLVMA